MKTSTTIHYASKITLEEELVTISTGNFFSTTITITNDTNDQFEICVFGKRGEGPVPFADLGVVKNRM